MNEFIAKIMARAWAGIWNASSAPEAPTKRAVWSASAPQEIYIYGFIEKFFGVTALDVVNALQRIKGDVTVHINSDGGDVFEAVAMIAAIQRHKDAGNKVMVSIDGIAASAASFLAMVASKGELRMNHTARMMIHSPMSVAFGNARAMYKRGDLLNSIEQDSMLPYYRRSGKSDQELTDILAAETWYSAKQALEAGFVDSIDNAPGDSVGNARAAFLSKLYPNFASVAIDASDTSKPRGGGIPTLRLKTRPATFQAS